jgi:tRNA pseudouridine55 synthase
VDGVLVVDKPSGPTSFEVVRLVKAALRADKAGHTGTLDPLATGVLAVCAGEAVKLQQYLVEGDKAYEAVAAFGAATDTEDAEGKVTARADPSRLDGAAVAAALPSFLGEIEQVPPMYSAVRVGGRRLHEAARAGEEVERPSRRVRIHALELLAFEPAREGLAHARLAVRCGKGTYVRTLVVALGRALGLPAHLAALRRTAAGPFSLDRAVPLAEVQRLGREDRGALEDRLVAPAEALAFLPAVRLDSQEARALRQGKRLGCDPVHRGLVRALDGEGLLVAVGAAEGGVLRPQRVLRGPVDPITR